MEFELKYQTRESENMGRIQQDPSLSLKKKKEALLELREGYKRGLTFFQDGKNATGIKIYSELDEKVNILIQDIESQALTIQKNTRKKLRPSAAKSGKNIRSEDTPTPVAQPRTREAPPTERATPIPATIAPPSAPPAVPVPETVAPVPPAPLPASAPLASQPATRQEPLALGEKREDKKGGVSTFMGGVGAFKNMFKQ